MKNKVFIIISLLIASYTAVSQEQNDSIVRNVLDTVNGDRFKIILFDNNTWEYVNNDSVMAVIRKEDSIKTREYILTNKLYAPDSLKLFSEKWDTVNIFAYGNIDYKRALDTFAIQLLKDNEKFTIPIVGNRLSGFGWRYGRMHHGLDIDLNTGDTVVAAFDGVVRFAGWNNGGYGYLVIIRHFNGLETYYAHLSSLKCKDNQRVYAGNCIGLGGTTGRSSGPHLHFETRFKDNPFDPEWIIDFETRKLKTDILYLLPEKFGHVREISNAKYHVVRSGDTLWGISRLHGVSIGYICTLNEISETTTLNIGQRLRVR